MVNTIPMPLATMIIAPLSGSISDRFDSRYISSFGALIMSSGLLLLSFFNTETSFAYIIITMIVIGTGFGMFQTPNNSSIMGNVPLKNRGTASGTLATMRNIGMTVGAALSGALFSFFQNNASEHLKLKGQSEKLLYNNAFVTGLHKTLIIAFLISVIAAAASFAKGKIINSQIK